MGYPEVNAALRALETVIAAIGDGTDKTNVTAKYNLVVTALADKTPIGPIRRGHELAATFGG